MFWDSSTLVPLLVAEPRTALLGGLFGDDAEPALWWASPVECISALYRRHRESPVPSPVLRTALARLDALIEDVDVVAPTDEVRRRTRRLLATHPLRAADALQLAAALTWCADAPAGEGFLSLDERLREAAAREGFLILPE